MGVTDQIKDKLDIVEYIGRSVPLKRSGTSYKGLCPFHDEKTPSFVVNPDYQSWRCFGACNEGGDLFDYVMKLDGVDFRGALEILASDAGVTLPSYSQEDQQQQRVEEKFREIIDEAARFYHKLLLESDSAEPARQYVAGRGLNAKTVALFKIGYAPDGWQNTLDYLTARGYKVEEIEGAGLAGRSDSGRFYDRFRNRVMIPIRDSRGRTVGFGARTLDPDGVPKYLNSPQSALFNKSELLFGLDMARRTIREQERAVIVEGYMDVMQAHQAGFTDVIAQMGTALNEAQIKQVGRWLNTLILALDPDAAGMNATIRDLQVVRESLSESSVQVGRYLRFGGDLGLDIRVVTLPEGKDPDKLIKDDPEAWRALLEGAVPVADHVIRTMTRDVDLDNAQRVRQSALELLPLLWNPGDELGSYGNVQKLASTLRLPEETLIGWAKGQYAEQERVQRYKERRQQQREAPRPPERPSQAGRLLPRISSLERYCLGSLLRRPDLLFQVDRFLQETGVDPLAGQDFTDSSYRTIFRGLQESLEQFDEEPDAFLKGALDTALRQTVEELEGYVGGIDEATPRDKMPEDRIRDVLTRFATLRIKRIHADLHQLRFLIQEAQKEPAESRDLTIQRYNENIRHYTLALHRIQRAIQGRT